MKNLKVSMKLIVSFMIMLAMAIAVGAFGIIGMFNMNAGDDRLYHENYLPSITAGDISQLVVTQRVYLRNFVIYDANTEAEAFQSAVNSMAESKKTMEGLISKYKDNISGPEDQAAYDKFVNAYNTQWLPALEEIQALGAANKKEEAKAALTGTSALAAELDKMTTELQRINIEAGETTVESNSSLFSTMTILGIAIIVLAAAVALFLSFYISGLISKPLNVLSAFMKQAGSTGDLTLRPEDVESINKYSRIKDEIGQTIGNTASFVDHVTKIAKELESIAGGDLTTEVDVLSERDTMGKSMENMVNNLNAMFGEINASTAQVATGSKQVADGSQSLAQGSTEQAASVQQLSSSIAEIANKTKENAEMADRAAALANTIMQNAEKGSNQMGEMMSAVRDINQASQNISKVIKVIDDIAFQTNILALNAAVEAARAGQHGKGFAVVAEEVRNLAAKSADAAKETGDMIQNSMEKAELGSRIAGETAESLTEIVAGINESSALVGEIARSSEEQSVGITQINIGIDQVAQVVQQNSATAEESAAASQEMSSQSALLQELISQFKLKGDGMGSLPAFASSPKKQIGAPKRTNNSYTASDKDFGKY